MLEALDGSRSTDAIAIALPALRQENPELRGRAMRVVAGIAGPEARAIAAEYVRDPDPGVRKAAFAALTGAGREALIPIEGLLKDGSSYIRWRAARMLGNLPSRRVAPSQEDPDPLVPLVIKKLAQCLQDPAPEVRLTAVYGYGTLGRLEGALAIVPLLGDPDPGIREETGRCLRELTAQDFGDSQERWRKWIAERCPL